jgi:hypothetical protein
MRIRRSSAGNRVFGQQSDEPVDVAGCSGIRNRQDVLSCLLIRIDRVVRLVHMDCSKGFLRMVVVAGRLGAKAA